MKAMSKNDSKVSKFIPLSVPFFNGKEKEYLNETIDSGWVSSAGPFVKKFESDIAAYVGAKYGIANSRERNWRRG